MFFLRKHRLLLNKCLFAATSVLALVLISATLPMISCAQRKDEPRQRAAADTSTVPESALTPRKGVTVNVSGARQLTDAQQDTLLAIARQSIAYYLQTGDTPPAPSLTGSELFKNRGCLVKLTVDGKTRGTSGYILPVKELAAAVAELSMRAATGGGRFEALKRKELAATLIQITVVSDPVTISGEAAVKVKKHGLVLMSGEAVAGILLPDDVNQSGSAGAAIDRLLSLARMTRNDWKPPEIAIKAFTVQVFEEKG
jgi:AMMECR1 domain-containing protein